MKYTKYNSPEKLFERFERVNKVKIDESVIDSHSLDSKLMEYYNLLKQNQLKVDSVNTSVSGGESFVELVCTDDAGNEIRFNFKSRFDEGNQDGVFNLIDGEMVGFTFVDVDGVTSVEVDESGLKSFNERFSNEIVDIISDFVDVEANQPEEALYNEAVKKIDERTFMPLSLHENTNLIGTTLLFENLPHKDKEYYLHVAKEKFSEYLNETNTDPRSLPKDDLERAVNRIAKEYFIVESEKINENYPDPIAKSFTSKKSDPFKEKRSSKKTMVINELNTDTVPGYSNINLPQNNIEENCDVDNYQAMNVGDDNMESKLLGYMPIRENEDGEHCVVWDGTSAYVCPASDAQEEQAAGNEVMDYFDDIDAASAYADELNQDAYGAHGSYRE